MNGGQLALWHGGLYLIFMGHSIMHIFILLSKQIVCDLLIHAQAFRFYIHELCPRHIIFMYLTSISSFFIMLHIVWYFCISEKQWKQQLFSYHYWVSTIFLPCSDLLLTTLSNLALLLTYRRFSYHFKGFSYHSCTVFWMARYVLWRLWFLKEIHH